MNKWFITGFLTIFALSAQLKAQEVEHNYPVEKKYVTCDSLVLPEGNMPAAIDSIEGATFRFSKTFKLTRKQGLRGAAFYSCDGESGFLVIQYDFEKFLFLTLRKTQWDELTTSTDPEGYYLERKKLWNPY